MWKTDLNFTRICGTKEVHLFDETHRIKFILPTMRQRVFDEDIIFFYSMIGLSYEEIHKMLPIPSQTTWDIFHELILNPQFTRLKETKQFRVRFEGAWKQLIPDYHFDDKRNMWIDDVMVNSEVWKWICYIFQYADSSEGILRPDLENEVTLKQLENERKIKKIKSQKAEKTSAESDQFMKGFIVIQYAFPSISSDDIWDKTLNEFQWLKTLAGKACSYEIERLAYATGNLKKKKIEFFLK